MSVKSGCQSLWHAITEPRKINVAYFFLYLSALGIGIGVCLTPPAVVHGEVGEVLSWAWGAILAGGGAAGAWAVLPGLWWIERLAIACIATAALIYLIIVIAVDLTDPQTHLMQAWVTVVAGFVFFPLRPLLISGYTYQPRPGGKPTWWRREK